MIFAKIETEVDSLRGDQSIRLPSNPFHPLPLVEKSAAILSASRVIVSTDLNRLVERKDSSVFLKNNVNLNNFRVEIYFLENLEQRKFENINLFNRNRI